MSQELAQAKSKTQNNSKREKQLKDENKDLNNQLENASKEQAILQKKLNDLMEYNNQAKNLEAQEIKLK